MGELGVLLNFVPSLNPRFEPSIDKRAHTRIGTVSISIVSYRYFLATLIFVHLYIIVSLHVIFAGICEARYGIVRRYQLKYCTKKSGDESPTTEASVPLKGTI